MFSKIIVAAAAVATVSASSIAPRRVEETISTMGPKLIDAIKGTIEPCATPSDTVSLLECVETTLVSELTQVWGTVQPFLMVTQYRSAGSTIDEGITMLNTVVEDCVAVSTTSEQLAECHNKNTVDGTLLGDFVDDFVVPMALCDDPEGTPESIGACMNATIDAGLVSAQTNLANYDIPI